MKTHMRAHVATKHVAVKMVAIILTKVQAKIMYRVNMIDVIIDK